MKCNMMQCKFNCDTNCETEAYIDDDNNCVSIQIDESKCENCGSPMVTVLDDESLEQHGFPCRQEIQVCSVCEYYE